MKRKPKRSPHWPSVRKAHLATHPACELCGNTNLDDLEVHHIEPFHERPELELVPENLITLCECSIDPDLTDETGKGLSCHLFMGHLGDFKFKNPRCRQMCKKLKPLIRDGK